MSHPVSHSNLERTLDEAVVLAESTARRMSVLLTSLSHAIDHARAFHDSPDLSGYEEVLGRLHAHFHDDAQHLLELVERAAELRPDSRAASLVRSRERLGSDSLVHALAASVGVAPEPEPF